MNIALLTVHNKQMKDYTKTQKPYIPKLKTVLKGIDKGVFSLLKAYLEHNEPNIQILDKLHEKAQSLKLITKENKKPQQQKLNQKFLKAQYDLHHGSMEEKENVSTIIISITEEIKFQLNFKKKSLCSIQ